MVNYEGWDLRQKIVDCFPGKEFRKYQQEVIFRVMEAFKTYKYVVVEAPTGSGKAQPLYSKIKTPNGWTTMGEIKIGDIVSAPDGTSTKITHLFPQGMKDVYKITFEDGRSTECCKEHLWKVHNYDWRKKEKILSLEDVIKYKNLRFPLCSPVFSKEVELPIKPYSLGCLLGDGTFIHSVGISNVDIELLKILTVELKEGYCLKKIRNCLCDYRLIRLQNNRKNKPHAKNDLINKYKIDLNNLNLINKYSYEKFIPDIYKNASIKQRLELVQGLMDTDGTVSRAKSYTGNKIGGGVSFTTTSYQLALDMQYMIRSLGGWCKLKPGKENPTYLYRRKGKVERRPCRQSFTLSIRHAHSEIFFKLTRKKELAVRKKRVIIRNKIQSVECLGKKECQCIMVDHPDHLYITDNFIVTHNSFLGYTCANILNNSPKEKDTTDPDKDEVKYNNACYAVVPYKTLQNQYVKEFSDIVFMKGLSNFTCNEKQVPCTSAPCRVPVYNSEMMSSHYGSCSYLQQRALAASAPITLFNTAAFLTYLSYAQRLFKPRQLIITDESHTVESAIKQFITISFNSESLAKLGLREAPGDFELPSAYRNWVENIFRRAKELFSSIIDRCEENVASSGGSLYALLTKEELSLLSLCTEYFERANKFLSMKDVDDNLVVSTYAHAKQYTIDFKPVMVDKFAQEYFFKYGKYFLFMSATVYIDSFCRGMGLKRKDVKYIKMPSTFPKANRPIYIDNRVGALNSRNIKEKMPDLLNRICEIAQHYKKYKGVIHTHTYRIADYIMQNAPVELKKRLIYHKGGPNFLHEFTREEALAEHMRSSKPTILLSPSMYEGIDLKDELGRWQVICKMPYAHLLDPQVKRRMEIDPEWYQWQTVQKFIQTCGRIIRSQTDWGHTHVLDRSFLGLFHRNSQMFPKWIAEAIKVKGG